MPWQGEGAPPLPAGYYMVRELEQITKYEIPPSTRNLLDEKRIIAIELFDEILMSAVGVHVHEASI